MLPGSTNILDQLLGGFDIKPFGPTGTTGVSAPAEPDGLLFGALLTELTDGPSLPVGIGEPLPSEFLFPSNDQPAAQDGAPAGLTAELSSLITLIDGRPAIAWADPNTQVMSGSETASQADLLPRAEVPAGFSDLPPGNIDVVESLLGREGQLRPAIYNVLDSEVENGRLNLTVVADGESAEPVRISVPISSLAQALASRLGTAAKAAVGQGTQGAPDKMTVPPAGRLDALLKELNLKTLEVHEQPAPVKPETVPSRLELTLVAENNGARLAIEARLNKHEVTLKAGGERAGASQDIRIPDSKPTAVPSLAAETAGQNLREGFLPLRKLAAETKFDLSDRLMSGDKSLAPEGNQPPAASTADRASGSFPTVDRQTLPSAVRFTVPELIQKPFSAQGQTIMIRIEPDHLGPARLNLAVRDQMLTARVTVDTPMAKLAVERSLDQLTDQLSRAGIDVDRIEVMLNDNPARDRFFDRRPVWAHARRMQALKDDSGLESDALVTQSSAIVPPRQYVGADGVNLLA